MDNARQLLQFASILCLLVLNAPNVKAQQQQSQNQDSNQSQGSTQSQSGPTEPVKPAPPIAAVRSPLASFAGGDQNTGAEPQTIEPDTRTLAGAQYLTVGGPAYTHSYWLPSLDVAFVGLSNPVTGGSGTNWTTYTSLSGELDVHKISGASNMALSYEGGGSFNTGYGAGSTSVAQQLALSEAISFRRWTLSLIGQAGYFPQAAFGYAGLGTGLLSNVGANVGPQVGFVPSQTILTAPGQRVMSTGVVETDILLTRRATLTMIGSGGALHYFDNNFNDTNNVVGQIGYSYQWTRADTVAVLYTFSGFRYNNINQSIDSHSAQISYARRLTGKMSFQASAGPEIVLSTLPITSSSGMITTATPQVTELLWTANSALTYQLRRTSFMASYYHGVTGGSGVLAGSVGDLATGTLTRQASRLTTLAILGGYSRNEGLSTVGTILSSQTYNYWYGGGSLTRTVGRAIGLRIGYQLQYQESNAAFCVIAPCTTNYTAHQVSVDVSFRPRLIPFD